MTISGKFRMKNYLPGELKVELGIWNTISNIDVVRQISQSFKFVIIDLEHGFRDFSEFENQINYLLCKDIEVFVRVRSFQDPWIQSILDMGVKNFLVPQIREISEVDYFVSKVNFPPDGIRGFHPKSSLHRLKSAQLMPMDSVRVFPLIETKESITLLEQLFKHDGIAGFYFGIYDLSIEIAHGDQTDPVIDSVLEQLAKLAHLHNKDLICMPRSLQDKAHMVNLGVTKIVTGIDSELIMQSFMSVIQQHEK